MRVWPYGAVIAVCMALAGCAQQQAALKPADAIALLETGQPVLKCGELCLADWQRAQSEAARLYAASRWPDLAMLVIGVGYRDDLTLFYLGRAAEGLHYRGAADSYYGQSAYLSGTVASCQRRSKLCGGLALPAASLSRRAAIQRQLANTPGRGFARPHPFDVKHAAAPDTVPDEVVASPSVDKDAATIQIAAPPAADQEPPLANPTPKSEPTVAVRLPRSSGAVVGTDDYIEPPAAR